MAEQLPLLADIPYDDFEGIDLRRSTIEDADIPYGARLILSDPPWPMYHQKPGKAHPSLYMPTPLSLEEIIAIHNRLYDMAAPGARLKLWMTWPLMEEWWEGSRKRGFKWKRIKTGGALHRQVVGEVGEARANLVAALTSRGINEEVAWEAARDFITMEDSPGGVWHKTGPVGPGYHHRGTSEPYLIYVKPGATPVRRRAGGKYRIVKNSFVAPKARHSEKPVGHLIEEVLFWTRPGELILEPFAGKAPGARAALVTGRKYLGFEPSPARHEEAMRKLRARDVPAWARILAEDEEG